MKLKSLILAVTLISSQIATGATAVARRYREGKHPVAGVRHGAQRDLRHAGFAPAGPSRQGRVRHRVSLGEEVALGVGGSYGRGVIACRSGATFNGPWSSAAMFALEGASIGFQLGAQATDFVLLVMNDRGRVIRPRQQGQARCRRFCRRRSERAQRRRGHGYRDAGRDSDLLARAGPLCRGFARGLDAAVGRRREREAVWPQDRRP